VTGVSDYDVKAVSARQLKRDRLWAGAMLAIHFVGLVGLLAGTVMNWLWWMNLTFFFILTVKWAMRLLSCHKQLPEQIVKEVMDA
jgi:fatty acid desaturase